MIRRHSILLICFAAASLPTADADAGCCDWLFGRTNSPYVAGYAPYGSYALNAPYTAAYPTVAAAPVSIDLIRLSGVGDTNGR